MSININPTIQTTSPQTESTKTSSESSDSFSGLLSEAQDTQGNVIRINSLTVKLENLTDLKNRLAASDFTATEKSHYDAMLDRLIDKVRTRLAQVDAPEDNSSDHLVALLRFLMQIVTQIGAKVEDRDSIENSDLDLTLIDPKESPLLQDNPEGSAFLRQFLEILQQRTARPLLLEEDQVEEFANDLTHLKELILKLNAPE